MNAEKQLWLLVGGNGAGKSAFYRLYLEPLGFPFVNADLLAQIAYPEAPEQSSDDAALLAQEQRQHLLLQGVSFCFETVYSHPSKIDCVGRASGKLEAHCNPLPAWALDLLPAMPTDP